MRALWFLFIALVTLGSIYPFDFSTSQFADASIGEFLRSCCGKPGRGDTVANILLFMPVGFTGMLGVWLAAPARRRLLYVVLAGTAVAFLLQVLQLFLPSRDENLQDVIWNVIGILAGAAIAHQADRLAISSRKSGGPISTVPLALVGAWLVYRLIPFIPSIDWQLFKDSLKPLVFGPLSVVGWLGDTVAWLIVAFLLFDARKLQPLDRYLPVLIIVVLALEIVIVGNAVNRANVAGAFTAVVIWQFALRNRRIAAPLIAATLVFSLIVSGLAPFQARLDPVDFNWLPFRGYLGGSMYINAQSASEKVFLYGSLVYLLWKTSINRRAAVVAGFSLVLVIEWMQTYFYGHTPEITDPLLVVFAAFALIALERREQTAGILRAGFSQSAGDATAKVKPDDGVHRGRVKADTKSEPERPAYVTETINLRRFQVGFLHELSREMEETLSGVVKRVIHQYVDVDNQAGLRNQSDRKWIAAPTGATKPRSGKAARSVYQSWERREIEVDAHTHTALEKIARKSDISVSRVIRRMIANFIEELDEE